MRPELIRATDLLHNKTPEAVEEAIGLLQNTVYSFSMKVCGHPEDAEDTMQEVLSRYLGHLTRIQTPQQMAVWLYTVTKNRCSRMRRKPANAPASVLSLEELMPNDAELGRLLEDAATGPERNLLAAEQHYLLHQAILCVPPALRIVLVLHDMEELSTELVAQILSLQPGTVRIRLHRARLSVRKEMSQLLRGAPEQAKATKPISTNRMTAAKAVGKRPTECRDLFANLSEYLDGRVEPRTSKEMRGHIEACPACVAFLSDLRTAIDRCKSLKIHCDAGVAHRLRGLLTREYQRMLTMPVSEGGTPQAGAPANRAATALLSA